MSDSFRLAKRNFNKIIEVYENGTTLAQSWASDCIHAINLETEQDDIAQKQNISVI